MNGRECDEALLHIGFPVPPALLLPGTVGSLTGVVWCGRDDNSPLPGTGSMIAGPLWTKIMRRAGLLVIAEAQEARRGGLALVE